MVCVVCLRTQRASAPTLSHVGLYEGAFGFDGGCVQGEAGLEAALPMELPVWVLLAVSQAPSTPLGLVLVRGSLELPGPVQGGHAEGLRSPLGAQSGPAQPGCSLHTHSLILHPHERARLQLRFGLHAAGVAGVARHVGALRPGDAAVRQRAAARAGAPRGPFPPHLHDSRPRPGTRALCGGPGVGREPVHLPGEAGGEGVGGEGRGRGGGRGGWYVLAGGGRGQRADVRAQVSSRQRAGRPTQRHGPASDPAPWLQGVAVLSGLAGRVVGQPGAVLAWLGRVGLAGAVVPQGRLQGPAVPIRVLRPLIRVPPAPHRNLLLPQLWRALSVWAALTVEVYLPIRGLAVVGGVLGGGGGLLLLLTLIFHTQ